MPECEIRGAHGGGRAASSFLRSSFPPADRVAAPRIYGEVRIAHKPYPECAVYWQRERLSGARFRPVAGDR